MNSLIRPAPLVSGRPARAVGNVAVLGTLVLLALVVTVHFQPPSLVVVVASVSLTALAAWMFFSSRYELTLMVLLLYLGLADGYLKLSTGSGVATLGRDILLYAIALGALARMSIRGDSLRLPPLWGWVAAFFLACLVQLLNPGSFPLAHGLASLRQHLEWVPLFFLGYAAVRSERRLRAVLLLLLVCGAANGVVSLVQFNQSPEQVADWGPGYRERIEGVGVAGRTFSDESGEDRVRPFGLGSDSGVGGVWGMVALPAGLALLSLSRRRRAAGLMAGALLMGTVLAVVTSQGRATVVGGAVALCSFLMLSMGSRRLIPVLAALAVGALLVFVVVSELSEGNSSAFSRYGSISPSNLISTTQDERGGSLELAVHYLGEFPLGAGLGSAGPAAGFAGGTRKDVSGETEFSFLVVELGILGLILFIAFHLRLLALAFTRIRRAPGGELRILLAGVTAPLLAIFATYFSAAASAVSPSAPYVWFAAGVLSFWLARPTPLRPQ